MYILVHCVIILIASFVLTAYCLYRLHNILLFQCREILQEEEDLSEIVQLVGKVTALTK